MSHYELIGDEEVWVDGREVRWARSVRHEDMEFTGIDLEPMHYRGFHVPLENSLIVSTQWGSYSYCSNRAPWQRDQPYEWSEQATSAEMACWWADGERTKTHTFDPSDMPGWDGPKEPLTVQSRLLEWPEGDTVVGWVPAENWWALIEALGQTPKGGIISDRIDILALVTEGVEVEP